ncbi:MAG TPA: AAA family ATPase [Candidatus Angelobacter sp.]|nr:AAA family ATPase [Candidatus Angelobacter sp.]
MRKTHSLESPLKEICFGEYRFDLKNECLWRGARSVSLRPKAFAVLKILVEHPGQLVNKQELMESVWPGTFVGDAVLKGTIVQLREALHDSAGTPRYIETAHRRGYRFIGKFSQPERVSQAPVPASELPVSEPGLSDYRAAKLCSRVLGRETELATMGNWLNQALAGERQTIFITGEAGIGKTTMVEAFLQHALQTPEVLVVRGQCMEHFGSGEAYLPVLDGFSRLCRSSAGPRVLNILREHAPSWLAHISSPAMTSAIHSLPEQAPSVPRERMLREMAEAIERMTDAFPVVLVMEDLHWSDYSTLDLIAYLARRRDPARVMTIGTYRPVDVILAAHPLKSVKRELQAHGLCHELPLDYLTEDALAQYLAAKFPGHQLPSRLRRTVYARTEGNPLFMVNLVEYLVDQKLITEDQGTWRVNAQWSDAEHGVPASVKELIEKQMERLSPDERSVLEAASATGMEFSTVAIAAGLGMPTAWVEKHCEELARRHQFLSPAWLGELPGGLVTARHRFKHVLYREVPYSLISAMRRVQIHQRIAERAVEIFGDRSSEIAAELAMHFEQSRDWPRALQYLTEAARTAAYRSAHHEAAGLARRGLEILALLPQTCERSQQEITLRMMQSVALIAIKGFAACEIDRIYSLGKELLWLNQPSPQLFNMLVLHLLFYLFSGKLRSAQETGEQLLQIAETLGDPALAMEAHRAMGAAVLEMGKFSEALKHFDLAVSLYPEHCNHPHTLVIAHDCRVICECFGARALWALGYKQRAREKMEKALSFARGLGHPRSWALAGHFACQLHQLEGEPLLARERALEVLKVADEYGMDFWTAFGNIDLGWAEATLANTALVSREPGDGAVQNEAEGIKQLQQGLAAHMATGAKLWCPDLLGILADRLGKAGRVEEAMDAITRALTMAEETEQYYGMAELYRIKGELIMQAGELDQTSKMRTYSKLKASASSEIQEDAQSCFAKGMAIARDQQAKSWTSRIQISMERLGRPA